MLTCQKVSSFFVSFKSLKWLKLLPKPVEFELSGNVFLGNQRKDNVNHRG